MKILMVSNFYPPYYIGGYELRCALVAEGLRRAGHDVRVLTSRYGLSSPGPLQQDVRGVPVQRLLGQYHHSAPALVGWPYFLSVVRPQLRDVSHFIRLLDEFQPDLINWWAISGLTKALLPIPKRRGIPDLFCIDDDWIIEEQTQGALDERPPWAGLWSKEYKPWYWRYLLVWLMERWKTRLLKQGIETAAVPFRPTHVCFVSKFLRDEYKAAGFEFPSSEVLYGGVPVAKFFFQRRAMLEKREVVRMLYAGFISRNRGLHTAIEALNFLSREAKSLATLTVVGDHTDSNYFREVREQVRNLDLSGQVMFIGKKSYDEMPEIYRRHDLLIAPSLRKEGLPFTMMEAMLSGCAVVTTGSGGAVEIARLADLPLFPKGDALCLSRILEDLIGDRQALERIARRGQEVATREFSADRMLQRFSQTFEKLHEAVKMRGRQDNRIPALRTVRYRFFQKTKHENFPR
jgi:glycogen(starch) synthase